MMVGQRFTKWEQPLSLLEVHRIQLAIATEGLEDLLLPSCRP